MENEKNFLHLSLANLTNLTQVKRHHLDAYKQGDMAMESFGHGTSKSM